MRKFCSEAVIFYFWTVDGEGGGSGVPAVLHSLLIVTEWKSVAVSGNRFLKQKNCQLQRFYNLPSELSGHHGPYKKITQSLLELVSLF